MTLWRVASIFDVELRRRSPLRSCVVAAGVLTAMFALCGCSQLGLGGGGGGGSLHAQSLRADNVRLDSDMKTTIYAVGDDSVASFYLSDVPVEDLLSGDITRGQFIHIELLWMPRAGRTPMDASAANISVRHVVIVDGEVGVYGGTGFAWPGSEAGADTISVSVSSASLNLLESTPSFNDLLSPAVLEGSFSAQRDDRLAQRLRFAVSQVVTNMMGRTTYVKAGSAASSERLVALND